MMIYYYVIVGGVFEGFDVKLIFEEMECLGGLVLYIVWDDK